ncbi:MAG: galactose-1-phosphate uridylyltransferase [Sulfobacillus acidophilus]|uniref:Galactose-1-phosphate uridylyltransferase n=1 Tax=Sulfobacillus acidophilus TaxID=53633 RepID=A0A2T2WLN9_9FIRM|nr:MAG: galactose-1-phosphate uridylyltransferase [Sulfobacillus acidophilus]
MPELRYNPVLQDWTMVASNRQARPDMPKQACPFCPGSGFVPDHYEVYIYDNDYPVLSPHPDIPASVPSELYRTAPALGKCEVILYSPDHNASLSRLSLTQTEQIVAVWRERVLDLRHNGPHAYILIFENRGREVGATISHPHGQLYALPFIPRKIRTELESAEDHAWATGRCLFCDVSAAEVQDGRRMVAENDRFLAYIPFFTDFPYGTWISSRRHVPDLERFDPQDIKDLAEILHRVTRGMDALYDKDFPYMMVLHQLPLHRPDAQAYYHFHIEFYPPMRDRDKVKFMASAETGAGATANPQLVEETAEHLREAIKRSQALDKSLNNPRRDSQPGEAKH